MFEIGCGVLLGTYMAMRGIKILIAFSGSL